MDSVVPAAGAGNALTAAPRTRARRRVRQLMWVLAIAGGVLLAVAIGAGMALRAVRHRLAEGGARNALPPMTQPADRPWDGSVTLYWGGTFRVIGLCENTDNPRWWKMDGSAIAKPPLKPHRIELPRAMAGRALKPFDRQICYEIVRPRGSGWGRIPSLKIDGSRDSIEWGDGQVEDGPTVHDLSRHFFASPGTPTLTLHGTLEDKNYQTFAIARSGQTTAGPLKLEYAAAEPGWTQITVRGDWQFDAQLAVIRRNGHQAFRSDGMSMSWPMGRTQSARFYCPLSDIAEVHFQMCGVQRFVATGIAANPGTPASPRIATEHLHPTLAGQPPLSAAPLPEQEPDPTPAIKLPAD